MENLFSKQLKDGIEENAPLAYRMRPRTLAEYVGQDQAVGERSWLRRAIEHDALSSIILYGPAGCGKTTLAEIIAGTTQSAFVEVSAVEGTVKDLRREIDAAKERLLHFRKRTILFVDEIHRFNKSQQDSLLHAVEARTVILVGATTENPYFEVNSALISRSQVIVLEPLSQEDIVCMLERALASQHGLHAAYSAERNVLEAIAAKSGGDARSALTTLELAAQLVSPEGQLLAVPPKTGALSITQEDVEIATPSAKQSYDKKGDAHYDVISAFIKSMRGSDPDAALYWLARMIAGGEDPRFIARRILICASEDIGNADPHAILVAEAAFKAAEVIGYPECSINLAQAATYLALAPKSNAAVIGIQKALQEVKKSELKPVPSYLRDRHRPGSDEYGSYFYPHNCAHGYVEQRYLPKDYAFGDFYKPSNRGWEAAAYQRLEELRKNHKKAT